VPGLYASRRNTYGPPARGIIAASSAQHNAPVMVITPASAQATSSQPGEPINLELSAEVMKMPDPIIEPITIIVPSTRVRPRTSLGAVVSAMAARFINSAQTSKGLSVRQASYLVRKVVLWAV
jgi:hypothetical protein